MSGLRNKVALITGAGRGQGRAHAVRLAAEGADIVAIDVPEQIPEVPYGLSTAEDLATTAKLVEAEDRRCVTASVDVRDITGLDAAVRAGVDRLGRLDVVVANAGILIHGSADVPLEEAAAAWNASIGVMLTGVWNTIHVTEKHLIEAGGGSIILISSTAGISGRADGTGGIAGYTAAKHGVVGLMRAYAKSLGRHDIRVNTVHPTAVNTEMITNPSFQAFLAERPDDPDYHPTKVLPTSAIEAEDVANAVAWLASDEARYVTGIMLPVDCGTTLP